MKTVSIIVGALAAFTVAAPAMVQEKRSQDSNFGNVNNFDFSNDNLAYLGFVNSLDFSILEQLVNVNSFNVDQFSSLFQSNSFDLNSTWSSSRSPSWCSSPSSVSSTSSA